MLKGVVQGYRPQVDWGGEGGSATIVVGKHNVRVATSGWRRRCIFTLLASLLIIVLLNLIVTFWILRRLSFNAEGAGSLQIVNGGVILDGTILLNKKLSVSRIGGRRDEDLSISGFYNVSIGRGLDDPHSSSYPVLILNDEGLLAVTSGFSVVDSEGIGLFSAKEGGTSVGADLLTITGEEGGHFDGSIQAPRVLGHQVHELRLESATRTVEGKSGGEMRVVARDGDVSIIALSDAVITARNGKIRFENPNVHMPSLLSEGSLEPTPPSYDTQIPPPFMAEDSTQTSPLSENSAAASSDGNKNPSNTVQVFQVCVCPSGQLFLVSATSVCISDSNTCR